MRATLLLAIVAVIACDPPDNQVDDTDPHIEVPAVVPGDRIGASGGGATGVSGGGYRLNVTAGDAFAVHERTDGAYRLRLGVGTTQDRTP
jgi:hypothetical protein